MKENFVKYAVPELHTLEGGNVDDPRDPGGRTGKGITQRSYTNWLKTQGRPNADVYKITEADWQTILKTRYWDAVKGDQLPDGVDYVMDDQAVNSGPVESIKWLQKALGVRVDGNFGSGTMAALQACDDYDGLIGRMCDARLEFMKELKTWKTYHNGWTARVAHVRAKGQALATGSVGSSAPAIPNAGRKAVIEDAYAAPPKTLAAATGTGGVVTTGLATVQTALAPVSSVGPISHILTGVAIIGAVITIGGFAWAAYANWRTNKRNEALLIAVPEPTGGDDPDGEHTTQDPPVDVPPPDDTNPPAPRNLTLNAGFGVYGVQGQKLT